MRFSNKDNAEFDAFVLASVNVARGKFSNSGWGEKVDDMCQDFALKLAEWRSDFIRGNIEYMAKAQAVTYAAIQVMHAFENYDEPERAHIAAARNVAYHHTPYNVLIAAEMADRADREGLMPVVMGDTLAEEAEHFNMSRQRIHQMVSRGRETLAEYLVSD